MVFHGSSGCGIGVRMKKIILDWKTYKDELNAEWQKGRNQALSEVIAHLKSAPDQITDLIDNSVEESKAYEIVTLLSKRGSR